MNLLQVERQFQRIEERENRVRYFYDPKAKHVRGHKQHVYIDELRDEAGLDKRRFGMSPYISNKEDEPQQEDLPIPNESGKASLATSTSYPLARSTHRVATRSDSNFTLLGTRRATTEKPVSQKPLSRKASDVRNRAALMKIVVRPEASASTRQLPGLMGKSPASQSQPRLGVSQSSPAVGRPRKVGGLFNSLKFPFAQIPRADLFARLLSEVTEPEVPPQVEEEEEEAPPVPLKSSSPPRIPLNQTIRSDTPIESRKESLLEVVEEAYGKRSMQQATLQQLSANTDLSGSLAHAMGAQYSTFSSSPHHDTLLYEPFDLRITGHKKPATAAYSHRKQMGRSVLSVKQRRVHDSSRPRVVTRSSEAHSHLTATPPSTLSPRIESMTGGYYRLPGPKKEDVSFSLLGAADHIEIKKLAPKTETPTPALIEEKSQEQSRDSYWPTPLPPMLGPETRAILRVSPVRRDRSSEMVATASFVLPQAKQQPVKLPPPPALPYWMRDGTPSELMIVGTQLVEARYDEFDFL